MKAKTFLLTTALVASTATVVQAQSTSQTQTTSPPTKQMQSGEGSSSSRNATSGNAEAGSAQRSESGNKAHSDSNKSSDSARSDTTKSDRDRPDSAKSTTTGTSSSTSGTTTNDSRDQSRSSDNDKSPSRDQRSDDSVQPRGGATSTSDQPRDRSDNPPVTRSDSDRGDRDSADRDHRNDTNTSRSDANRGRQTDREAAGANNTRSSINADINISEQQRTRVSQSIAKLNVQPVTNVNFSLSVGTTVPRDVRLQTVPADIVEIVPQYRGYSFFIVRDEIVIVEPSTFRIVTVLSRGGARAEAAPRTKTKFTDQDRDTVRKYSRKSEPRTTGTAVRSRIGVGERVPAGIELEAFPEDVYTDAPSLREYRYLRQENRTYVIEPRERTIIEEID